MHVSTRLAVAAIAASLAFPALSEGPGLSRRSLGAESRASARSAAPPGALAVGAVSHLLLPTSANVTGAFGAVFRTKVSIFNAVDAAYEIRIGLSNAGGEIDHRYLTISPFQTVTEI